jgi:hypothetical protein
MEGIRMEIKTENKEQVNKPTYEQLGSIGVAGIIAIIGGLIILFLEMIYGNLKFGLAFGIILIGFFFIAVSPLFDIDKEVANSRR